MQTQLIDGKTISKKIREEIAQETLQLEALTGQRPKLSVVIVGEDPASVVYVRNKEKGCREVGFDTNTIRLSADVSETTVLETIEGLNEDPSVNGILVQLPLPKGMDEKLLTQAISPQKDVDGFHIDNMGKLLAGITDGFVPCTPSGILQLLHRSGVSIEGKLCAVVGRSEIVGKPTALLLQQENGTVICCHSKTKDPKTLIAMADIIVVSVGRPHFLTGDMIKEGAVVIDVGINRENGKLLGDCDIESCMGIASKITPVPGGVGPMTITMLLSNCLKAFKRAHRIE